MNRLKLQRHIQLFNHCKADANFFGELGLIAELILRKIRPDLGWNIRIILVPEREIIALNERFFKRKQSTDVISFNLTGARDRVLEGEVYLSLETAARQAAEYGTALSVELQRLTAHGLYHLLGYEDDSLEQKKIMTDLEDEAMGLLHSFSRK